MTEWCQIESDPGIFTDLLKTLGVSGIQVDEIFDLSLFPYPSSSTYGLIFLFKYLPIPSPPPLASWDPDLFFSRQCIVNACATQALLSILLNNSDKIRIGSHLSSLKEFTREMTAIDKGLSISNSDLIRTAHNRFARPDPFAQPRSGFAMGGDDVFHYVAFVHFKRAIYELDGMKEGPVLLGEDVDDEQWVGVVVEKIRKRIEVYMSNEIKCCLMAVGPNRGDLLEEEGRGLLQKRELLKKEMKGNDLIRELEIVEREIEENRQKLQVEIERRRMVQQENERRQHNYVPLIFELLKIMNEKGKLQEVYNNAKMKLEHKK